MKNACIILILSMLVASAVSSSIIPPLLCPMTHSEKREFLDCMRPKFTPAYKRELKEFLRCAGLRHLIDFVKLSCDFTPADPQVRHVVNCLHRYPGAKDLPGTDADIQACANLARL